MLKLPGIALPQIQCLPSVFLIFHKNHHCIFRNCQNRFDSYPDPENQKKLAFYGRIRV